jgi:hypothetical protein
LQPHSAGTFVTVIEDPDVPLARFIVPPPVHALQRRAGRRCAGCAP